MNIIMMRIFRNKYGYAVLYSFFLFIIRMMPNERNPYKLLWNAFEFSACVGLLLQLVSRITLILTFLVLFVVIHFPNHLPQYGWVVQVINFIKDMPSTVLLALMIMYFYSLISIMEWFERILFWN